MAENNWPGLLGRKCGRSCSLAIKLLPANLHIVSIALQIICFYVHLTTICIIYYDNSKQIHESGNLITVLNGNCLGFWAAV